MRLRFVSMLLAFAFLLPASAFATYTYSNPTYSSKPSNPDYYANSGIIIRRGNLVITLPPDSIPYDSYIEYGRQTLSSPIRIGKYWSQCGFIEDLNIKSHFNDAIIESQKNGVISWSYKDCSLSIFPGFSFPENSVKVVYSSDNGNSWYMLRNPVIDYENKTVSYATDFKNGGYMLMAGFVNPKTYYNYRASVQGASADGRVEKARSDNEYSGLSYYAHLFFDFVRFKIL